MASPPVVWVPPIIVGLTILFLYLFGFIVVGPCVGGYLLFFGLALLCIGTGVGLATELPVLIALDGIAVVLLVAAVVAANAGIC